VSKGTCHKVKFRKFKGEKYVGFLFWCYFMKIPTLNENLSTEFNCLGSHLSHKSLSLILLSSNEMHHTFIPFIYSVHGSSSHQRGHTYPELISSYGFLSVCQMMFHLIAFHPSRRSIKIHLLCLYFHLTKLIHPLSQHSLINSGFK